MDSQFLYEVEREVKRLYYKKYGKRNPATVSSKEIDDVNHAAMVRVQDRRKGRLVE